jgi:hypothetical protein
VIGQHTDAEEARLREELRMCQRELAQVREQLESLEEGRAGERRKRRQSRRRAVAAEKQLRELSVAVDQMLRETDAAVTSRSGFRDRLTRRSDAPDGLKSDIALLESSALFRGPWYVRRYPHVVVSGLRPARHYLELGAGQRLDPGPEFSTDGYLREHPEIAATGTNPLLDHLRTRPAQRKRS